MLLGVLAKLNWVWRLFGTGLMFLFFGLGGLFLGLFIIPLIRLSTRDPKLCARRIKRVVQLTMKLFLFGMSFLGVARFEYYGLDLVHEDMGAMILANHPSLIDIAILFSLYPQANCIVKRELWENKALRFVVSGSGYIPNDQGELILDSCRQALADKDSLIIFPEGTRSTPGQPLDLKRGAAQVALRLKSPIRVVYINVNPPTLLKGQAWYKIPPIRPVFSVHLGRRLWPEAYLEDNKPISLAARQLTRELKETLDAQHSRM